MCREEGGGAGSSSGGEGRSWIAGAGRLAASSGVIALGTRLSVPNDGVNLIAATEVLHQSKLRIRASVIPRPECGGKPEIPNAGLVVLRQSNPGPESPIQR